MKRLLVFALALGLLVQCRNPGTVPGEGQGEFRQTFLARPRQTILIPDRYLDPEPVLKFKLLSLEHTSCPPTADCCNASWATARFTLEWLGQASAPTEITFPQCDVLPKTVAKVALGSRTFEVTMTGTQPQINFSTAPKQDFESAFFVVR